ncbi:DNA-binding transcriptional regulator, AcrR family [Lentzea waywayandensis]|uniref:DNA-binding transcriptional regulator, AcrR family n=1 Tax=Lentzea waywayandensis TaxID=84724 RepID=A0A1I6FE02_9PSEU|nr:TetR/AcrR family transcriptional regulator [Lentzea waywayandensis]SFR27987.1 DNA-binding transcriptional regulator, AcrR family [Lentzea waywayandensis]
MSESTTADTRSGIVAAAAHLLRTSGAKAVTTRAVAQEAGVPPPTIFRLFGDKDGLLEAVAEHVLADYVATKATKAAGENGDPVEDLRAAWHAHIAFNLANPDVFLLLVAPGRLRNSPATTDGAEVLRARVARVAAARLLKVSQARAVDMFHAAGTGATLALLAQPEDRRDPDLATAMLDAVLGEILTSASVRPDSEPIALAVALKAALPEFPALSEAERTLLAEWLTRAVAELQDRPQR